MSCKIEFKNEHKKNDSLSRSEKLVYATVYDKDGNVSRLWEDVKKIPFLKNLEEAEGVFLNYYAFDFNKEQYVKYSDRNLEPKLFYKSTKGNIYESYKEALVDSEKGNVEVGFINLANYNLSVDSELSLNDDVLDVKSLENHNFTSVLSLNTNINKNTVEGFVNDAILNDILSGEQVYDLQGNAMFAPDGAQQNKQTFNGALFYSRAIQNFDRDTVTKDTNGNVRIADISPVMSGVINEEGQAETLEETIAKVQSNGFDSLVNRTSPEQASDIVVADFVRNGDFEKFFSGFPIMEKSNLSELRDKMFSVINRLGIQLTSIEEYKKNYRTKYNVEPDVKALADITNGVIALSQNATVEDLTEELSHFLVETMNEAELDSILNDLYLTDSVAYQNENQKYREIYSKQGLSEAQTETKVRKEVLGKMISQGIINQFRTTQNENERSFIGKIINFIERIVNKLKFQFNNPRIQVEIQDVIDKISNEVLNEEITKVFSLEDMSERYNGVNPLYYSTTDNKVKIIEFKRALEVLENRLRLVKDSKVKDLNAYRNSVKRATDALANGHQWLTAKIIVSEAENLVKKVNKSLSVFEKSRDDSNLMLIKNDHDLLKNQLIPTIENLRTTINGLEITSDFTEEEKKRILDQITAAVAQQSLNVTKFNDLTRITNTDMFQEIAKKYGVSELYLPYIVAALTQKQNDISTLFQWFGNPEHSSVPYLGLLSKILQDNELKKMTVVAPLAKAMEKFLTDNNWKHSDYHEVMERDENGNFTFNLQNPIKIAEAIKAQNDFETATYNRLKFGDDQSQYVTSEEYSQKYRLNSKGEKTEPIELIDETNMDQFNEYQKELMLWREQNQISQYHPDVYRERNAINRALGVSTSTILFRNNISSDRASAFARISNDDNQIDPSKLDKDIEAVEDLNDITARLRDAASPFDVYTGRTYFTVSATEKETINVSYQKADGSTVNDSYEIPKIIFLDVYDKYNTDKSNFASEASSELKLAYDLTRINLFNQARYANDSRTINEKFYNEISDIENFYAKEKGFGSYNEARQRATPQELDEVTTNINRALRKFTEVVGGLGFNDEFYQDLSAMGEGMTRVDKLNSVIDDENVTDYVRDKALSAKSLLIRRGDILKKYRSRFNPAEIDVQLIPQTVLDDLQRIDETIDSTFNDLRNQLPQSNVSDISEPIASYELNEAFEKDLKDSKLGRVEFMLLHVKNNSSYVHIKSDFRNFEKNGVKSNFKNFLGLNGYLTKDGTVNSDYINAIRTEAGLERVVSEFLSSRVYSYYKRFTPNGYGTFINNLNEGKYYRGGENVSFGEFLRNMSERQNGNNFTLGSSLENYFKINPALQYTDGTNQSFKEQLNPLYNPNFQDGRTQWNLDKFGDRDFFNKYGINFEEFKNNPLRQEEMLQEAASKNKHLEFILRTRDLNRLSLDMYGESRNFSPYRIARARMTASESTRNIDKPIDRIKGWYNQAFTRDMDVQDDGAMTEDGKVINKETIRDLRIIPKYGLYDIKDMKDMSTDIYYNTLTMLNGAINYDIKRDNMADVLKLESALEQAEFINDKKGKDSNAYKMFKEYVDAQYFGILRNNKWEVDLFGKKIDLTRVVSSIDRYVRKVNTAWSVAVSVTGLSSFSLFGLTEALTRENLSAGAFTFGFNETMKDMGNFTKEIGQLNRDNKSYVTARLLGIDSFDPKHNSTASGRSLIERVLKNPSHKITEAFTNHTGIQVANAMLYDTRFYEGKWYSYNEFRNQQLVNNKSKKDIDNMWVGLRDTALYFNYDFSENNDKLRVSDSGLDMMRNYYRDKIREEANAGGQELSNQELNDKVESKIADANRTLFSSVAGRTTSLHSFLEGRIRQEQASSATRNAFFNPLLAHRGWFSNTLQRKFKNGQYNFITGQYEMGSLNNVALRNPLSIALNLYKSKEANKDYSRAMIGSIMNPVLSVKQEAIYEQIKELQGEEAAENMRKIMLNTNSLSARRTGVETVLLGALLMFGALVAGYVDDPDRKDDFTTQYFGYLYFRLASEYGSSNIVTGLPQTVDMVNRPAIMFNLFKEIVNEDNYSFDPVKSGVYKGMPKIASAIAKQTSLRQLYDFGDITKKSQSYRHFNSSSLGFGFLEKDKAEDE